MPEDQWHNTMDTETQSLDMGHFHRLPLKNFNQTIYTSFFGPKDNMQLQHSYKSENAIICPTLHTASCHKSRLEEKMTTEDYKTFWKNSFKSMTKWRGRYSCMEGYSIVHMSFSLN